MALNIEDPEVERLARRLAQLTGETVALATTRAIEERLRRIDNQYRKTALLRIWPQSVDAGASCLW
jgi:antitoxin VapB